MPTTVFFPKIFKYNFPLGEEHIKDVRLSVSAMMKVKKITVAILWCMKMKLRMIQSIQNTHKNRQICGTNFVTKQSNS